MSVGIVVIAVFGLSLSVGVAGSVATVSDARSGANQSRITRGSGEHEDRDKHDKDKDKDKDKCDDDRGKSSTPKACNDDDHQEQSEHED